MNVNFWLKRCLCLFRWVYWATEKSPASLLHRAIQMNPPMSKKCQKIGIFWLYSWKKNVEKPNHCSFQHPQQPIFQIPIPKHSHPESHTNNMHFCINVAQIGIPIKSYWIYTKKSQNSPLCAITHSQHPHIQLKKHSSKLQTEKFRKIKFEIQISLFENVSIYLFILLFFSFVFLIIFYMIDSDKFPGDKNIYKRYFAFYFVILEDLFCFHLGIISLNNFQFIVPFDFNTLEILSGNTSCFSWNSRLWFWWWALGAENDRIFTQGLKTVEIDPP